MTQDLSGWTPRPRPGIGAMTGRRITVEPIAGEQRFDELFDAFAADPERAMWRWLPYGPFSERGSFQDFARKTYLGRDPMFHTIVPAATGRAAGVASLMRIDEANGVVEIGHIALSPALQRKPASTEMQYLMMRRVFDELGYRRYEWKCNYGNEPSKRAAERLGFRFEGVFRQHMVVKGENRDTAWFSILDREWPAIKAGFEEWLDDANFTADGRQIKPLEACRDGLYSTSHSSSPR